MAFRQITAILLAMCIAASLILPAAAGNAELRNPPKESISEIKLVSSTQQTKTYTFDTGDTFTLARTVFKQTARSSPGYGMTVFLAGTTGTVTYIGNDGKFCSKPISEGLLPSAVLFFETDTQSLILGPGVLYRSLSNGILRDSGGRKPVRVTKSGSGYTITIGFSRVSGCEAQLWWMRSSAKLVNWDDAARALWIRLNFNGKHRLCYDGAYYISSSSYSPYALNSYYRCPAVHPATVLLGEKGNLAVELSYCLLDNILDFQNSAGWWPMPLRSSWLYNDYGIGAGYYDTRFNNDLTVSLFKIAGLYDDPRFTAAAEAQCGWFLKYAEQYSTIITGDNLYGLLVEDYCQADSTRGHTHTSLNHQLQEMKALLAAYHATGKSDYQDLAYRMLNGIKATESLWTDSQQGLVYALLNGKAVGHDYPYLTYNDLYEFQLMLPQRDAALDRLMLAKRLQMERDGITGYYR